MNVYMDNIKSKGWDTFIKSIETEFKHIREELSVNEKDVSKSIPCSSSNREQTEEDLLNFIRGGNKNEDIKKEFSKLREELNINSFSI